MINKIVVILLLLLTASACDAVRIVGELKELNVQQYHICVQRTNNEGACRKVANQTSEAYATALTTGSSSCYQHLGRSVNSGKITTRTSCY